MVSGSCHLVGGRAVFPHPALGQVSHHGMHKRSPRLLGREAQCLLESPEQARSSQTHANLRLLDSSRRTSNQDSFPPCRLCCSSGACGTMSPSDFPPGSTLMDDGARPVRPHRTGSPVLPCVLCGRATPRPRRTNPGHRSDAPMDSSGLPGYSCRSARATSRSRSAQASHMLRPVSSLTHPKWASVPRASSSQLPCWPSR